MSNQDRSNTTKKSTVYVALITALAIIIGSVILGLGGQTTPQEPTPEAAPAVVLLSLLIKVKLLLKQLHHLLP